MRKGVILIVILLFPSIIYMFFSLGEHRVERVDFYGDYVISTEGDTVYQPVPDVELIDQTGKTFALSELRGKPVVIDIFSVPCDDVCKKKGVTLVNYLRKLNERDKWLVISIANSTEIDQQTLQQMQKDHLPEMDNWLFVRPVDHDQLKVFAKYAFVKTGKLPSFEDVPAKEFLLIDQNGLIREYFDSRIHKENRKIEDAIKVLLQEPHLSWKNQKE